MEQQTFDYYKCNKFYINIYIYVFKLFSPYTGSYSENLEREEKPRPCGGDVTSQLVAAAMLLSAFSAKQTTLSQDDVHREEHNVYRKEDNVPNEEHNVHREEHKPSMYIGHSEDMSSISTHCADHCKSHMISRFAVGSTVSHRESDASRHVVPCKRKRDACEELLREEETQKAVKQTRLRAANRLTWFSHTFKRRQAGDNIVISAIRKRAQLFRRRSANIGAYLSRQVARLL